MMNAPARQSQRSVAAARPYSSDHLPLDSASPTGTSTGNGNGKWMQQVEYSRMLRSMQKGSNGDFAAPSETPTTPMRLSSQRNVDLDELSLGFLDLHSFELLPEMSVRGAGQGGNAWGRGFDDAELGFLDSRQIGKACMVPESGLFKGFSADNDESGAAAKIKVVCKRPLIKKEIDKKEDDIIVIEQNSDSLSVHETKLKVDLTEYVERHEFVFDVVLDEDVSNEEVYRETVEPIVPAIFQRMKATCFAYGQTGSGKTYTMQPLPLKASHDILRLMQHTHRSQGFQLFVSFFEIYGGKLYDLLNERRKLCMREDGKQQVCIVGLQEFRVSSVETIRELIEKGNAARSTGTTGANEESSRSHAILQLVIKKPVEVIESRHTFKRSADGNEPKPARLVGKLSFIDLAGSERGADTTDNDKQTRIEGAEINKSLLALKECIRALDNDQVHIPFRGSKLTEVLRDSFIGNSRTVMISCISPNSGSCEHTLNTLRYADRVKSLSKGSNSKKDVSSTTSNLRESAASPLSSPLPDFSGLERASSGFTSETHKFGWSKPMERESALPPSGREEVRPPSYAPYGREQTRSLRTVEEFDSSGDAYEREWRKGKVETYPASGFENRDRKVESRKDARDVDSSSQQSDDDLNALLKEEEDLVIAHRKQVEETINIVREEMKLLDEADQPGNQLDVYVSRLSDVLSQKASGIVSLQARLARFQRRLTDHNVLVSSLPL